MIKNIEVYESITKMENVRARGLISQYEMLESQKEIIENEIESVIRNAVKGMYGEILNHEKAIEIILLRKIKNELDIEIIINKNKDFDKVIQRKLKEIEREKSR